MLAFVSQTLVEMRRIELLTPCLQGRCSPSWATPPNFSWYLIFGFNFSYVTNVQPTVGIIFAYVPPCYGNFVAYRSASLHDFTPARSYDVSHCYAMLVVGLSGLEPPTSRLSGVRSNRLSYKPIESGIHLLSHAVSSIVPSAAYVLTVVFGMGTGVSHKRIDTRIL